MLFKSKPRKWGFTGDKAPAQRWAFEVDAMGAMDDAVENGVSQGGVANDFMPAIANAAVLAKPVTNRIGKPGR